MKNEIEQIKSIDHIGLDEKWNFNKKENGDVKREKFKWKFKIIVYFLFKLFFILSHTCVLRKRNHTHIV